MVVSFSLFPKKKTKEKKNNYVSIKVSKGYYKTIELRRWLTCYTGLLIHFSHVTTFFFSFYVFIDLINKLLVFLYTLIDAIFKNINRLIHFSDVTPLLFKKKY